MRLIDNKDEWREYVLDMCQVLHDFCTKENIKYSLAYGTLLGAYRHNGFIPWDDDFDLMMTREDFDKFQKSFSHPRYKCVTCFNSKQSPFAFPRLIDTYTYSLSGPLLSGKKKKGLGVCIDLYIVENVPEDPEKVRNMSKRVNRMVKFRRFTRRIMKGLSLLRIRSDKDSFYPMTLLCKIQSKIQHSYVRPSRSVICFSGPLANGTVLEKSIFDDYVLKGFENREFMTISSYDVFLTKRYGDWRQLPPENERLPHHGGVYYTDLTD